MAVLNQQALLGYMKREDIQSRIDSQELSSYSVVFTSDTLETVVIGANKELIDIHNKIYVFASKVDALAKLNARSDTYEGQLVAIKVDDAYRGHIVNKSDAGFYVTDLCNNPSVVNYDDLNHKPIVNLDSDAREPINIKNLDDGIYKVTGVFNTPDDKKVKSTVGNIVVVETNLFLESKSIIKISNAEIIAYTINADGTHVAKYITDEYLKSQGYVTDHDVDVKLAALNYVTHEEMERYVYETFSLLVDHILDEKLDERLKETTTQEINELFE